jgi:hypothetical protein
MPRERTLTEHDPIADAGQPYSFLLGSVVTEFKKRLYLNQSDPVVLSLASVAANRMDGPPVWLMVVGPPSSGKTAIISSVRGLPKVIETATLTEASLLSGTAKKDRAADATGGLLRQIGERGILLMKDFTSVLSMNRDMRGQVIAALREIHDGRWTRSLGTDGAKQFRWSGKMGLLAGVTDAIDDHHSVIASMGDRFLYHRLQVGDRGEIAKRVLDRDGSDEEVHRELREAVQGLFSLIEYERPEISAADKNWISSLAVLTADSRGAVERDTYRREIIDVRRPESPGRLAGCFGQLYSALTLIGCSAAHSRNLVAKVGYDSIPRQRARLISALAAAKGLVRIEALTNDGGLLIPKSSVRRALEDLECFRMVYHIEADQAHHYQLDPAYAPRFKAMWPSY